MHTVQRRIQRTKFAPVDCAEKKNVVAQFELIKAIHLKRLYEKNK